MTEGALPPGTEQQAGKRITDAFLRWHDLAGNTVMTPNVTSHIVILPKHLSLSGGDPFVGAWIETKTPSFALSTRDVQEGFFKEATDILQELSNGALSRDRIFGNALHTVDGTWNMDGQAMTNEQIGQALSRG
tara:strand:- start:136065 stop:136463 length:399 start_codon:yes stop_codon:yes gene_type:complete